MQNGDSPLSPWLVPEMVYNGIKSDPLGILKKSGWRYSRLSGGDRAIPGIIIRPDRDANGTGPEVLDGGDDVCESGNPGWWFRRLGRGE